MAERSDADDRLQSALDARFRNSSTENTENIATKQAMMACHISIYVYLGSLLNKHFFQKRARKSLDESYLFLLQEIGFGALI